ncbi:response regulator transcription factor [Pseudomonas denitrificans (nom. rej.)]|uniref:Response regulator transcription factor n=1 Tax=Pseudomonas denitrificans TaxID=43306 RepID=A0A9X7R4E3_PSEDE|nr:response regulator transcription factor [Pseudomonas denitrificans (nom. rej.)]
MAGGAGRAPPGAARAGGGAIAGDRRALQPERVWPAARGGAALPATAGNRRGGADAGGYQEELTAREAAVLERLAEGLSNQEIADALFLSVNTVKYHAKNINAKLGTSRRTQAIAFAKARGLLA